MSQYPIYKDGQIIDPDGTIIPVNTLVYLPWFVSAIDAQVKDLPEEQFTPELAIHLYKKVPQRFAKHYLSFDLNSIPAIRQWLIVMDYQFQTAGAWLEYYLLHRTGKAPFLGFDVKYAPGKYKAEYFMAILRLCQEVYMRSKLAQDYNYHPLKWAVLCELSALKQSFNHLMADKIPGKTSAYQYMVELEKKDVCIQTKTLVQKQRAEFNEFLMGQAVEISRTDETMLEQYKQYLKARTKFFKQVQKDKNYYGFYVNDQGQLCPITGKPRRQTKQKK